MSRSGLGHRACSAGWLVGIVALTGLVGCHMLQQGRDEKPKASKHTKVHTASSQAKAGAGLDQGWELPPAGEVGLEVKAAEK